MDLRTAVEAARKGLHVLVVIANGMELTQFGLHAVRKARVRHFDLTTPRPWADGSPAGVASPR
ncbi:hypothetical protein [Streptomyces nigra]|uniref:hypothetical protein n=1 Tax=Streptomyces nigra TaxID=1827580 RepID=UPI003807ECB8